MLSETLATLKMPLNLATDDLRLGQHTIILSLGYACCMTIGFSAVYLLLSKPKPTSDSRSCNEKAKTKPWTFVHQTRGVGVQGTPLDRNR